MISLRLSLLLMLVLVSGCVRRVPSAGDEGEDQGGDALASAPLNPAVSTRAPADSEEPVNSPEPEGTSEADLSEESPPRLTSQREDRVSDISFDDLDFEIEADEPFERDMLTEEIEAMHGTRVRLRGFMLPAYREDGIDEFVLVKDNQTCCFGPGAKICHNAMVMMEPNHFARYTTRVVIVEGEFRIEEWLGPDGVIYSCFRIIAKEVRST